MNKIEFYISDSQNWIQKINQCIPSTLTGNRLTIDPDFGKGSIEVVPVQEGLHMTLIDIGLKSSLKLERIADDSNNFFILNFYFTKTEVSQTIKVLDKLKLEHCGVLLSSGMTSSESVIPADLPIKILNITFSKDWLFKNIVSDNQDSRLFQIFKEDKPIYLFENIDYTFHDIYKSILSAKQNVGKMWLTSGVLRMLTHFFEKIESHTAPFNHLNINSQELKHLMKAKNSIENNWEKAPSNEDLAQLANMSHTKFKKLFKQVFRKSPYQYYIAFKMGKAKEMLAKNEHSVSCVGYYLGYSNLSQFSKAFKKVYNILPKEVKQFELA